MADGVEARDELIGLLRVCDVTESWRESVLEGTEGMIGGLVVAPMLCNTFDDTGVTVVGAGFEEAFELFFDSEPPIPPPMAPPTNRINRSSESQKVAGR